MTTITELPVHAIEPEDNDRKRFDQSEIEALAASIEMQGLLSPVRVRPKPGGGFYLIAGERRWRAHLHLGRPVVECVVVDDDDRSAHEAMLAENTNRVDLGPIEEARAYRKHLHRFGSTIEEVAAVAGREPAHVRWRLGLLELAPDIVEEVARGALKHTTAELMVGLDVNRQRAFLSILARQALSWDEQRLLARRLRLEQDEEPLFNADSFELQSEEYVAKAKADNVALTPRQMAQLTDEVLDGLEGLCDLPQALAAKVDRLRGAIDYRLKRRSAS